MTDLPTVDECQEFLVVINRGREAAGLDRLEYLDFDNARPGQSDACLSATNLFVVVPGYNYCAPVGESYVHTTRPVAEAIAAEPIERVGETYGIPPAILKVTDPFDKRTPGLRECLVEAGVVAP